MENLPQLVPLVIFFPLVGFIINVFWGSRLGEKWAGYIGCTASILAFIVSLVLLGYLNGSNYQAAVVSPPLLDGWIRIGDSFEVSWQQRVDTLSVTMMLVVTGVGSLIHIYAIGYMHGDERFARFFSYLNLFLVFMLILVTGNNFLMMFVGWEGVGLCSYLLIGFWWDKPNGVGWRNSDAARKAMIVNRIGDFGLLMGIFLIFTAFGTLDYYRPGEIANPEFVQHQAEGGEHAEETATTEGEAVPTDEHTAGETAAAPAFVDSDADGLDDEWEQQHFNTVNFAQPTDDVDGDGCDNVCEFTHGLNPIGFDSDFDGTSDGDEVEAGTVEVVVPSTTTTEVEGGHGEAETAPVFLDNEHIPTEQLGVFGQAERFLAEGRQVRFGPFTLDIGTAIAFIAFFMLIGATGKSAQIPLFVWLPDAMVGPTPVSALIHAATMVTAGVYMMVRANVFYEAASVVSFIVAMVGALTAITAGFIAVGQWDIKRVLAYSTISQLGFMVAAVGVGAFSAAMFHLVTHAFFKALLFLGSGSVIHGVEHGAHETHDHIDPQDMRVMGGLRNKMPITYWTYVIGTLALAGIFPFAGFWSKDEILADSLAAGATESALSGYLAFIILLAAAGFTAFYMWRQVELVFHGEPRSQAAAHAHESVPSMTIPLVILAFLSIFGGFLNTPANVLLLDRVFGAHRLTTFLEASVVNAHAGDFQIGIAAIALALGVGAIFLASRIYGQGRALVDGQDQLQVNPATRLMWGLANARLYWDETYHRLFVAPFQATARFLADTLDWSFWHNYFHDTLLTNGFNAIGRLLSKPFDLGIIDGAVNGVGWVIRWLSGRMRTVQTGYVRTYAVALLLGVVVVLVIMLLPMLQR
jgi:NADH-quinone oxidoreductase subunit L